MFSILKEVLKKIRYLVINQARYQVATSFAEKHNIDLDIMYHKSDSMTNEEAERWLKGTPLLDNTNLQKLVKRMGVGALYDDTDWLDDVGEYVSKHKKSCYPLWHHINQLPDRRP